MNYPKRYKRRAGTKKHEPRDYPRHRQYVRGFGCMVPRCKEKADDADHISGDDRIPYSERKYMNGKAHDKWTVPLCRFHHIFDRHTQGIETFQRKHGIDFYEFALVLQRKSPAREQWEQDAMDMLT